MIVLQIVRVEKWEITPRVTSNYPGRSLKFSRGGHDFSNHPYGPRLLNHFYAVNWIKNTSDGVKLSLFVLGPRSPGRR